MLTGGASERPLGGPKIERRLAALRRRFEAASPRVRLSMRARRRLRDLGRRVLVLYWLGCLTIIAAGLNRAYPELWPRVQRVLPGPAVDQPFPNCSAAQAAGVYNIPAWSPGYAPEQDSDSDGIACESRSLLWGF